jgi:hypothetical protein
MQLILVNQTNNETSYANGQVVLPAAGQVNVGYGILPYLAVDFTLRNDLTLANTVINDGYNNYQGTAAVELLTDLWIQGNPPQNSSDPIAFALAGNSFSVAGNISLTSTTQTAVVLLQNPLSNTINARAMLLSVSPQATQGTILSEFYTNPTLSNNGTSLIPQNSLISSSAPASAINVYSSPTVNGSNYGTLRLALVNNAGSNSFFTDLNQTIILAPGNSVLITFTASNLGLLSNVTAYYFLQWVEI